MRVQIKVILIVLLTVAARVSAAQPAVLQPDYHTLPIPAAPATQQQKQEKPQHPACLTEEQETHQASPHMRWPLLLPALASRSYHLNVAWQTFKASQQLTINTPLQAFYRTLLYPAHFFR